MRKKDFRNTAFLWTLFIVLIFAVASGCFYIADRQARTAYGLSASESYHFTGKSGSAQEKHRAAKSFPVQEKSGADALPEIRMVGYYAAWAAYSGFTPDRIDPSKLTHINYAFANIGTDLKVTMGYPDKDLQNFVMLNKLKEKNPGLKTLISVGGWTWSGRFSDAAATDAARIAFSDSCVAFMKKHGFDGIDLDWEYPVSGGLAGNSRRSADKHNFTLLLRTLREKLDEQGEADQKHYLLTIAAGAGSGYPNQVELSSIHRYLDYATIMTYDIHGVWDPYTDLHAPLYQNTDPSPQYQSSADASIRLWEEAGFPMQKLVMGIPFYGYRYSSVTDSKQGLYGTFSGGNPVSYQQIEKNYLNKPGYQRYFHSQSKVPWLFNGSTFITYEDPESIGFKADYIRSKGLGGAMIWELSQDLDKRLLNALYDGLR